MKAVWPIGFREADRCNVGQAASQPELPELALLAQESQPGSPVRQAWAEPQTLLHRIEVAGRLAARPT